MMPPNSYTMMLGFQRIRHPIFLYSWSSLNKRSFNDWSYSRSLKRDLQPRFEVPTSDPTPPLWSRDCILGTWQAVCIYVHLQPPRSHDCNLQYICFARSGIYLLLSSSKTCPLQTRGLALWPLHSLNKHRKKKKVVKSGQSRDELT